jgi:metal-responsive CopG/Arc/MetJ family transcriptional regulator
MVKTVQMTIDEQLLSEVDEAAQELETSRSAFVRDALRLALREFRVAELERLHAEGYARQPVVPGEFDVWINEQAWSDS